MPVALPELHLTCFECLQTVSGTAVIEQTQRLLVAPGIEGVLVEDAECQIAAVRVIERTHEIIDAVARDDDASECPAPFIHRARRHALAVDRQHHQQPRLTPAKLVLDDQFYATAEYDVVSIARLFDRLAPSRFRKKVEADRLAIRRRFGGDENEGENLPPSLDRRRHGKRRRPLRGGGNAPPLAYEGRQAVAIDDCGIAVDLDAGNVALDLQLLAEAGPFCRGYRITGSEEGTNRAKELCVRPQPVTDFGRDECCIARNFTAPGDLRLMQDVAIDAKSHCTAEREYRRRQVPGTCQSPGA
ncbi:MAG TPA: hypothetical protein PKM62_06535 [Azospira sp.]|nr:hypothetical protein [Azospira sp.]